MKSETSIFRNKERSNGDAKRSFKHVITKANDPKEFPKIDMIFWFVLYQDKMNRELELFFKIDLSHLI